MEKGERIRRMKICVGEKLDLRSILDEYSWSIINEIAITTNVPIRAPDGLGQPTPSPAQPSPAHGPKIFETKTMGWAGPMRFFGGRPWAESFCPWFNCSIKIFLIHS